MIDRWHPASTRLLQLSCCLRWLFEALQKSRLLLVELNKPPAAHTERRRCVLTASALIKNMACWEQREVRTRLLKDSPLSLPAENFNFPTEPVVAQHALCPASGPLGRGRGKIGSNCSGVFKDGFSAMRPSVNHRGLLKTNRAAAEFSGCFHSHCGLSQPLNLLARRTRKSLPDEPGNVIKVSPYTGEHFL